MNDKRLAVRVEDHPLEYGDFEGVIPAGNYGAGGIIVWDRGEWVPLEDWREGLEKGKLLFELKGYKLRGKWTLVKIKKSERDWLLIKERDAFVKSPGDRVPRGIGALRAHRRGGQEPGRRTPRAFARRSRGGSADARRVDPDKVAGDARRDGGRGVHERRLALRAQARRLSPARVQVAAARRCCSRATATTTPRCFPRSRERSTRCRSTRASSTARSSCSTPRGSRASRCCSSAAASTRARHQPRGRRAAGDVLRVRPARVRGLRRSAAAR